MASLFFTLSGYQQGVFRFYLDVVFALFTGVKIV